MQRITKINEELAQLHAEKMALFFVPVNDRKKDYTNNLRSIKKKITVLSVEKRKCL